MDQRLTTGLPRSQRSAISNDPLGLPRGLSLTTRRGRRWRDLALAYSEQLGLERMEQEAVRTRVRTLIWLTVEVERLQETRAANPHTALHYAQEMRALLAELFPARTLSPARNGSSRQDDAASDDAPPLGDFVRGEPYIQFGHYVDGELVVTAEDPLAPKP